MTAFGQYKFVLDIKTKTLSGKKISLNIFNNQNFIPINMESFVVVNGHHTINGELKQPTSLAALIVSYNGKDVRTNFVLDSGINNVSLDTPITITKSLTLHSSAKGSIIFDDLNNLFLEMVANYKEPSRVNGYLKISNELMQQITQAQLKRLQIYPNDFASLLYLHRMSHMDALPESAKRNLATLATFSNELRNSDLGKQLFNEQTNLINNKIIAGAGNTVPLFEVKDLQGNLFSNSSLKGQPYMIVFSATWCGPCQEELPKLKKLYQTYKQKGLKVIYFNDDDNITRWKEHVTKNNLTWINVSEGLKPSKSKIPKSFGVYSIPTCLIIDKKGLIVYNSDETDTGIYHIESFIKKVTNN